MLYDEFTRVSAAHERPEKEALLSSDGKATLEDLPSWRQKAVANAKSAYQFFADEFCSRLTDEDKRWGRHSRNVAARATEAWHNLQDKSRYEAKAEADRRGKDIGAQELAERAKIMAASLAQSARRLLDKQVSPDPASIEKHACELGACHDEIYRLVQHHGGGDQLGPGKSEQMRRFQARLSNAMSHLPQFPPQRPAAALGLQQPVAALCGSSVRQGSSAAAALRQQMAQAQQQMAQQQMAQQQYEQLMMQQQQQQMQQMQLYTWAQQPLQPPPPPLGPPDDYGAPFFQEPPPPPRSAYSAAPQTLLPGHQLVDTGRYWSSPIQHPAPAEYAQPPPSLPLPTSSSALHVVQPLLPGHQLADIGGFSPPQQHPAPPPTQTPKSPTLSALSADFVPGLGGLASPETPPKTAPAQLDFGWKASYRKAFSTGTSTSTVTSTCTATSNSAQSVETKTLFPSFWEKTGRPAREYSGMHAGALTPPGRDPLTTHSAP